MKIRNKLLLILLSISLIPLIINFALDISFSHIVRGRIQNNLRTELEERANESIIDAVNNYEEKLKIYSQAVRYGLNHYSEQVQRILLELDTNLQQPANQNLIWLDKVDLAQESHKYILLNPENNNEPAIDFDSVLFFENPNESQNILNSHLRILANTCKDIYSINPESKLWIYTILEDGTSGTYPSTGSWLYPEEYDFRQENWYLNVKKSGQLVTEPRIEPLTGKSVMTIAMPLLGKDKLFSGIAAMDIDLSGLLESIRIPNQWQEGAWKFILGIEEGENSQNDNVQVICATPFIDNNTTPPLFSDFCNSEQIIEMIKNSRTGKISILQTSCHGTEFILCYGPSVGRGGFPLLAIPYQRIIEQVNNTQQILFRNNIRSIQLVTLLIFIVILIAIFIGILRARNITNPITHLADAAEKLAQGDFDARVEINTNDEFRKLGDIFNQTGPKLKAMEKMQRSLELAGAIQKNLLPKTPPKFDGFELAGMCKYCDETGGDYYDFIELEDTDNNNIGIALGDVTGHGIGAALLMAAARSILRSNAQLYKTNLSKLFDVLNNQLVNDTDYDKFITLFYGVLNSEQKSITWASGGHDPALWYHKDSGQIEELPNTGMPIGIMEDTIFEQEKPILLKSGDIIVIGTDGIWEAQNEEEVMFGKERLYNLISSLNKKSANEICSKVINEVVSFIEPAPQLDDITLIVIKVL